MESSATFGDRHKLVTPVSKTRASSLQPSDFEASTSSTTSCRKVNHNYNTLCTNIDNNLRVLGSTTTASSPRFPTAFDVHSSTSSSTTSSASKRTGVPETGLGFGQLSRAKLDSSGPVGFGQHGGFRRQYYASTRWVSRKCQNNC